MVPMRLPLEKLYPIAEDQAGYVTAAQAAAAGVPHTQLLHSTAQGRLERVSRGVYRLTQFPVDEHADYHEAVLWPQLRRTVPAVISHASALVLYGMSEVRQAAIDVTVPPDVRIRRAVPARILLHRAALTPAEITVHEGLPVTTPARAIRDAAATGLSTSLVRQAVIDGSQRGLLTLGTAHRLAHDLLGEAVVVDQAGLVARVIPSAVPER